MQFLAPAGRPIPADSRSNDRLVSARRDHRERHGRGVRAAARAHVEHASTGPQTLPDWNPNAGGIEAFYFRDPDGNNLEVLRVPARQGRAAMASERRLLSRHRSHGDRRGEHGRSLRFYRDVLGMRVAGTAENYGPEQERFEQRVRRAACASRRCARTKGSASSCSSISRRARAARCPPTRWPTTLALAGELRARDSSHRRDVTAASVRSADATCRPASSSIARRTAGRARSRARPGRPRRCRFGGTCHDDQDRTS